MKTTLEYYDIFPRILCTEVTTVVTIQALGEHVELEAAGEYRIRLVPMNNTPVNLPVYGRQMYAAVYEDGVLHFSCRLSDEQQYAVLLQKKEKEGWNPCCELRIYALRPDFFRLRPFRGDMHCHTCRSDGAEGPSIVAANYRKAGFDFLSITDHGQYEPSLEAIRAYEEIPMSFRLFSGEEVHPPKNHCHTVHFGGDYSVNDIFRKDPERYEREVDLIAQELQIPVQVDAREYASLVWVYRKIREAGGMAVMAHPCWIQEEAYHISRTMYQYLLRTRPFDALELTCGQSIEENQLQVSLWQQMREEGNVVPVVGSSDSHGTVNAQWFGLSKMIVLAERCEKDAIIDAVKARRAVVLEQYHKEEFPRVYGENRAVEFVLFLIAEYMPLHDELCYEEGRLMKAYACGDKEAGEMLRQIGRRTEALFEKYWA
ncbi:MAG: hypothetical protein K2P41_16760 [Lachnospiraceae bacterium]|nr:hypothetical protein [Lachnospiraceae bacterium]